MNTRFNRFAPILTIIAMASAICLAEPPVAKSQWKGDPYPLDICIVSGESIVAKAHPLVRQIDGREVRFCCKGCVNLLEHEKSSYLKKLDDKIIEQQIKHYPLKSCVVMDADALDNENESVVNYVYGNRLVRLCCSGCIDEFNKEPAKYIAKLDAAVIKQQKDIYPLTSCPISGETLGEKAVDRVVGVTLVRLCNQECVAKFLENPQPVMVKIREAWIAKHANQKDSGHP